MSEIMFFDPDELEKSKCNVRRKVDEAYIEKLARNIEEVGLQHYPVVRKEDGEYRVVAGWARTLAVRKIKRENPERYKTLFPKGMPCVVKEVSDQEAILISLSENIHARTLTPEEVGAALQRLKEMGVTEEEIERRLRLELYEIKRALDAWEAAKKAGVLPSGRPGRPPEKTEKKRKPPTRKIVVTAHITARKLVRRKALPPEEEEKFVKKFVEEATQAGLSSKEVEKASKQIVQIAEKKVDIEEERKKLDELIKTAIELVKKEDIVERVVAFRRPIAEAISNFARKRGLSFDEAVNELLKGSLRRRGYKV